MSSEKAYPVMETFTSVQGEGAFTGVPSFFIRLGGCDVGCVWCDVKDSWDANRHPQRTVTELVEQAVASGVHHVIVTGGEPTMYDLSDLTSALKQVGKRVHIETSGTNTLTGEFDWITFSPKKFKAPLSEYFAKSHELKVIVYHKSDLIWAEELASQMPATTSLYLQAEWEKREQMTPLIFDHVIKNPRWRVGVQIHKYMGVE